MKDLDIMLWIETANHDSESADILINENGYADVIIYHYHQATEKLLKALLIKNNILPERTHSLDKFLNILLKYYPDLSNLSDGILSIHKYLPMLRYPQGEIINFNEAVEIQNIFIKIKNTIMNLLK